MGSCISSPAKEHSACADPSVPLSHPQCRKLSLVAIPLDQFDVPMDLSQLPEDSKKIAMRNRCIETEHWAVKVVKQDGKSDAKIFNLKKDENNKLQFKMVDANDGPWKNGIIKRVDIGWTVWENERILNAIGQLVSARPVYDGRSNNLQQLGRMLARHIQYNPEFDSLPKPGNAAGNGVTPTLLKDGKQLPLSHRTESFDSKGNGSDLSNNSDGLKVPAIARPSPNSGTASNASSIRLTERRHSNSLQRPASMDVYGSSNLGNGSSSNLRTSMNEQQLNKLQASREKAMLRSPLSPSPSGSEREKARARVSSMSQTHGLFPSNPSEHVRSSSTASLVSRGEGSRPALEGAFSPHQRIRNMSASHLSEWDRPAHSRHVSDDGYRQQSQRRASLSPNNASPHLPAQQPLATNGSSSRNSRQMEPSHSGRRHSQVQGSSMPRSLSRADDVARRMSTFDNGLDPLYAPPQPWMNHPNHSGGSLNLYPNSAPCSAHHSPALGYAGLPTPGGSSPNPFAAQFGPAAPTAGPWGYHMPPSMPVTMSMPYGMPPAMHMNPSLGLPSMPTGMMGLPMVPSMASMQASPGGMHLTVIPPSSSNIAASMTPPLTPNQFEKVQMSGGGKRRESRHY